MQKGNQSPSPAPDAQTFEELHCAGVPISTLSVDNQTCSICVTQYGDASPDEDGESPETPIQINFGNCHHAFGHRCFRKLIDSRQSWSNKCPLCRTHWFSIIEDLDTTDLAEIIFGIQEAAEAMNEGLTPHERELYDPHAYLQALLEASESREPEFFEIATPRDRNLRSMATRNRVLDPPQPSKLGRARDIIRDVYKRWRQMRDDRKRWDRLIATTPIEREGSDRTYRGADLLRVRAEEARSPREGIFYFEDVDRNGETTGYYSSQYDR